MGGTMPSSFATGHTHCDLQQQLNNLKLHIIHLKRQQAANDRDKLPYIKVYTMSIKTLA